MKCDGIHCPKCGRHLKRSGKTLKCPKCRFSYTEEDDKWTKRFIYGTVYWGRY